MNSSLKRFAAPAALLISLLALVFSMTGVVSAGGKRTPERASTTPRPNGLLLLNKKRQFPASVIPKVRAAKDADKVGGKSAEELSLACPTETSVEIGPNGTYCLSTILEPTDNNDLGKSNFAFATRFCAEQGGFLPSAAQLVGAADFVRLAGTIDDDRLTANTDVDFEDGRKDQREMSSTLVTTAAGSSAAGSQGVTEGSQGDPRQGEPDPVPRPANPSPDTLQYVTVYDNRNQGGFAGSRSINQPERFRCGFNKVQVGGSGGGEI